MQHLVMHTEVVPQLHYFHIVLSTRMFTGDGRPRGHVDVWSDLQGSGRSYPFAHVDHPGTSHHPRHPRLLRLPTITSFPLPPQPPACTSATQISLRKGRENTRIAKIFDSPSMPEAEAVIAVTEGGITDGEK